MAIESPCQTPGTVYETNVSAGEVSVTLTFEHPLSLTGDQIAVLKVNLHNALELVMAPFFGESR